MTILMEAQPVTIVAGEWAVTIVTEAQAVAITAEAQVVPTVTSRTPAQASTMELALVKAIQTRA